MTTEIKDAHKVVIELLKKYCVDCARTLALMYELGAKVPKKAIVDLIEAFEKAKDVIRGYGEELYPDLIQKIDKAIVVLREQSDAAPQVEERLNKECIRNEISALVSIVSFLLFKIRELKEQDRPPRIESIKMDVLAFIQNAEDGYGPEISGREKAQKILCYMKEHEGTTGILSSTETWKIVEEILEQYLPRQSAEEKGKAGQDRGCGCGTLTQEPLAPPPAKKADDGQ